MKPEQQQALNKVINLMDAINYEMLMAARAGVVVRLNVNDVTVVGNGGAATCPCLIIHADAVP